MPSCTTSARPWFRRRAPADGGRSAGQSGGGGPATGDTVEALVRRRPHAVLGLATGSSPLPAYRELGARHLAGSGSSYASVELFLLDEYVGLPGGHPQSYRATIERGLTGPLDIDPRQLHAPDPAEDGLPSAGTRYEDKITAAGGIDLQILGIGTDGHLASNEPGSSLASRTRLKTLTAQTRADNAPFFGSPDRVPRHVLTQGLGTILEAATWSWSLAAAPSPLPSPPPPKAQCQPPAQGRCSSSTPMSASCFRRCRVAAAGCLLSAAESSDHDRAWGRFRCCRRRRLG